MRRFIVVGAGLFALAAVAGQNTYVYQCKTAKGVSFQQTSCDSGKESVHVYDNRADVAAARQAHQSVVDAINELNASRPTASGKGGKITVVGTQKAEDGKADGYRAVDRSVKSGSY